MAEGWRYHSCLSTLFARHREGPATWPDFRLVQGHVRARTTPREALLPINQAAVPTCGERGDPRSRWNRLNTVHEWKRVEPHVRTDEMVGGHAGGPDRGR